MGQAKLVFTGKPTPVYYTVSFDTNGGTVIEDQTVIPGAHAVQPMTPTKPSFSFRGWLYNGETFNFLTTPIDKDMTIVANFE